MYICQGLRTQKEQQLDRFCTAWEDLKWERDAFTKEINRRDWLKEHKHHTMNQSLFYSYHHFSMQFAYNERTMGFFIQIPCHHKAPTCLHLFLYLVYK